MLTLKEAVGVYDAYGVLPLEIELDNLTDLYDCYENKKSYRLLGRIPTIEDVLKEFIRRNGHQRRMRKKTTLVEAVEKCKEINLLGQKYNSFEELYEFIEENLRKKIWGFGPLATYDLALRVGNLHHIEPSDYVYINAGAYEGAKLFLGRRPKHIEHKSAFQPLDSMLSCKDIEHFFCIYKSYLEKGGFRKSVVSRDLELDRDKIKFKLDNI